jgi:solute carrier family 35 protein
MWCNGLVCIPLLTVYVLASGELAAALSFHQLGDTRFQGVLLGSCVLAFALNYTIFMNTAVNSALTQTVCGNLKVSVAPDRPLSPARRSPWLTDDGHPVAQPYPQP